MKLSRAGAQLIEGFEGFSAKPYRDPVGVWTIGYGSTKGVGANTPPISREQARARLMREVDAVHGAAVNALGLPLDQPQFDALTSFVYNVGPGGVAASTGIGRALRRHDWDAAADELLRWNKAGGRALAGLTRRREAERAMFLSAPSHPLAGYTESERRWIREFDRLHARTDAEASRRRQTLVRVMTRQRKRIWTAAQPRQHGGDGRGWRHAARRARYRSLLARTAPRQRLPAAGQRPRERSPR